VTRENKIPVFIISGKSPIGATGGGYSTYAYNLAGILKKLGHPVYIVALGNEDKEIDTKSGKLLLFKTKLPFLNVNIYALPGLPVYSLNFAKGINKIIKKEKYKKIIIWGIGPWGLTGTYLKIIHKGKIILLNSYFTTIRHEWWGGVRALKISDYGLLLKLKYLTIYLTVVQYLALLEKTVLKSADMIITNYKSTEEILKSEFGIKPSRFHKIHAYAQIYKRMVHRLKPEAKFKIPPKYIFFFSRHDPRKGVNFLLRAMKILIEKGYKIPLLIAGDGDMLSYNKRLAKKLIIEKWVKFLGFVNNPKVLMENCTLFVFPSIEEGSSALTINEAMEMGLPIISTACDGIIEDIESGKSGILVPKENPDAMASAISNLLDNPDLAVKLGKNAKQDYENKFKLEYMKKDIRQLLSNI